VSDADVGSTFSAPVIPSAGAVWRCCSVPCTMTSTADLLDPSSAAYKKARRQFYKATKNRPAVEQDWTPFRTAEKSFKARFPPPDLSGVLDLAQLDPSRQKEIERGVWKGSTEPFPYRRLEGCERSICVVPAVPGAQALVCTILSINSISWTCRTRDPSVVSQSGGATAACAVVP
jgi:hypothetical protein